MQVSCDIPFEPQRRQLQDCRFRMQHPVICVSPEIIPGVGMMLSITSLGYVSVGVILGVPGGRIRMEAFPGVRGGTFRTDQYM